MLPNQDHKVDGCGDNDASIDNALLLELNKDETKGFWGRVYVLPSEATSDGENPGSGSLLPELIARTNMHDLALARLAAAENAALQVCNTPATRLTCAMSSVRYAGMRHIYKGHTTALSRLPMRCTDSVPLALSSGTIGAV